jgi:hypothetical protein
MVGPGIIAMGISIGAGEWLFGPVVTVDYQGRLMCLVLLVVFLQAVLNTECVRYTLNRGEPIFTGFMRLKPGSLFVATTLLDSRGILRHLQRALRARSEQFTSEAQRTQRGKPQPNGSYSRIHAFRIPDSEA